MANYDRMVKDGAMATRYFFHNVRRLVRVRCSGRELGSHLGDKDGTGCFHFRCC